MRRRNLHLQKWRTPAPVEMQQNCICCTFFLGFNNNNNNKLATFGIVFQYILFLVQTICPVDTLKVLNDKNQSQTISLYQVLRGLETLSSPPKAPSPYIQERKEVHVLGKNTLFD